MDRMKAMRGLITLGVLGLLVALLVRPNRAQGPTDGARSRVNVKALMQRKLESSQAIVEALALDDPETLQREAQRLQLLSLDAGWNVLQTEQYGQYSRDFRQAAKRIGRAGKEKNLDAAGLGYFQLTMTCIDCHRHIREHRKGKKE